MNSDTYFHSGSDLTARQGTVSAGVAYRWWCLRCGKPRPLLGARGVGVRKRCAVCVAEQGRGA